jgi:hypothetical protein
MLPHCLLIGDQPFFNDPIIRDRDILAFGQCDSIAQYRLKGKSIFRIISSIFDTYRLVVGNVTSFDPRFVEAMTPDRRRRRMIVHHLHKTNRQTPACRCPQSIFRCLFLPLRSR